LQSGGADLLHICCPCIMILSFSSADKPIMTLNFRFLLCWVTVAPILCHSTEYCVRPTDSNSVPFHNGHICRTLNQYIDDSVHYFTSNTRFRFLPGNHEVNAPVIIQDIENLSLEAFNSSALPLVVSNFSCGCGDLYPTECSRCSAFEFQNVTNVSFKGMNIISSYAQISDFRMRRVYEIAITQTNNVHLSNITVMGGIIIKSANNTTISNVAIYKTIKNGIHIRDYTNNTNIVNTKVIYTISSGIYVENADGTVITQTIVMNSAWDGIHFWQSTKSTITYVHIFKSSRVGIGLLQSRYFLMTNITVVHSNLCSIYLDEADDCTINNAKVMEPLRMGVGVFSLNNVVIGESEIHGSIDEAVFLQNVTDSTVFNTTTLNSSKDGISIYVSQNVSVRNIRVLKTVWYGVLVISSVDISLYNATVLDSAFAISVAEITNATLTHVETDNQTISGIIISLSNNTFLRNAVVKNTKNAVCSDIVGAIFDTCYSTDVFGIMICLWNNDNDSYVKQHCHNQHKYSE